MPWPWCYIKSHHITYNFALWQELATVSLDYINQIWRRRCIHPVTNLLLLYINQLHNLKTQRQSLSKPLPTETRIWRLYFKFRAVYFWPLNEYWYEIAFIRHQSRKGNYSISRPARYSLMNADYRKQHVLKGMENWLYMCKTYWWNQASKPYFNYVLVKRPFNLEHMRLIAISQKTIGVITSICNIKIT